MIDFDGIAAAELSRALLNCQSWLPAGKLRGHEWVVGGLDGSPGESLSISVTNGRWADFATGAKGGDLVSLYAAINNISQSEAARQLGNLEPPTIHVQPILTETEWVPVIPIPDHAGPPMLGHRKFGKATQAWQYRDRAGRLTGVVSRFEPEGERKQIVPQHYCERSDGRQEWRWLSAPKPRGLYGAELLGDAGRVLIVEGEKAAEAGRRLVCGALTVVTWPGGAQAVQYADWSMLAGRDCVIWPDADTAGLNAAANIVIQLRHNGSAARIVELPSGLTDGFDLADAEAAGWSMEDVLSYIDPPQYEEPDWNDPEPEPVAAFDFAPLGHDKGKFYIFTSRGGQVRELSSRDLHSVSCLCELARLRYWEANYPGKGEAGFNVRAAGDAIISACFQIGIYDPNRVRGLGAWLDEGRTILHVGDRCIVDGKESSIIIPKSRYIYENSIHMDVDLGDPLTSAEANLLRELCCAAPWERPDHMGQLLAGWIVIAPVCGAMPWRPHLWITSEGGGGKTWLLDNILKPVVGPLALQVQSKTTEAALRQALGCDARPVIFDEVETQNERDRERVQHVLDIARQASSEDGAPILKGSSSGKVNSFRIRSCFAFSSINVGMSQSADESRTVVLTLTPDQDPVKRNIAFARLKELHAKTMVPGFAGRLLARTLSLLPVIRTNAQVFAEAIARSGKARRLGDTYGVLMAGAWSLRSRAVATAEEADKMVAETKWVKEAVSKSDVEPEWQRALTTLMQYRARVMNSNGRADDIPIGDLIASCSGVFTEGSINPVDASTALSRMGIRPNGETLLIANRSAICGTVFERTAWATCWHATISRTPGAKRDAANIRLGGNQTKCLSIPNPVA